MAIGYFPSPEDQSVRVWFKKELDVTYTEQMNAILKDAQKEHIEAQKLSEFLTFLNSTVYKSKSENAYEELQKQYFGELNIESYLPKGVLTETFIKKKGEYATIFGERFEEQFANILGNFLTLVIKDNAPSIEIGNIDVFSGHTKANPKGYDQIVKNMSIILKEEDMAKIYKAFGKEGGQKFEKYIYDNAGSFKNEKIDIDLSEFNNYIKNINLENLGGTPQLEEILKILAGATFSVKTSAKEEIHLGSTNIYKIYVANLTALGADSDTTNYSFLRAIICINNHRNHGPEPIPEIFNKMTRAYELMGYGLSSFQNLQGSFEDVNRMAKFLLIKETYNENIHVESTKYMLQNEITNFSTLNKMKIALTNTVTYKYR